MWQSWLDIPNYQTGPARLPGVFNSLTRHEWRDAVVLQCSSLHAKSKPDLLQEERGKNVEISLLERREQRDWKVTPTLHERDIHKKKFQSKMLPPAPLWRSPGIFFPFESAMQKLIFEIQSDTWLVHITWWLPGFNNGLPVQSHPPSLTKGVELRHNQFRHIICPVFFWGERKGKQMVQRLLNLSASVWQRNGAKLQKKRSCLRKNRHCKVLSLFIWLAYHLMTSFLFSAP